MRDDDSDPVRITNHVLRPIAGVYELDPVHTFLCFTAQHLVVGRIRGHFGRVSGTVTIGQEVSASAIEVSVDTSSVNTFVAARDEDLRSEHYLDVATYPTMTYRSTSVAEVAGGSRLVIGDLCLRGVTRPLELLVRFTGATIDPWGKSRVAFHATGSLTRSDFGITHELLKEAGGLLVRRDISIEIDAEATLRT